MIGNRRYITRWLSGMLMLLLLLLTACSKSSSDDSDEPEPEKGKPVLKIYVFPPDQPIVTRAGDDVNASDAENKIHNLHVWVFENHSAEASPTDDGKFVGHISLNNVDIASTGSTVTMEISDALAEKINYPAVDVYVDFYVAANVTSTNCGLTLDASTTRDELKDKLIKSDYFGVSNLIKAVPADGLPMSGVMKNKKITGTGPVYQVSEESGGLANVRLVRTVSKIRFIFSMSTENPDNVAGNNISLDGGVLPKEEYLFLEDDFDKTGTQKWRVNTAEYESEKTLVTVPSGTEIARNVSPTSYTYQNGTSGQDYENLINTGVSQGKLTDLGTFYLRESDRALTGKISYRINDNAVQTPTFSMSNPENANDLSQPRDFSRNHTWIVYAYFISSGDLIMGMVEVKNWTSGENSTQGVYNW